MKTHFMDSNPDSHFAGVDLMLCGMWSTFGRPLRWTKDTDRVDCKKCFEALLRLREKACGGS